MADHLTCLRCRAIYRRAHLRCPLDGARLQPGGAEPLVGTWFAGRYLIEELIGHGTVGRTYRARHLDTRRPVALKVPFGELAGRLFFAASEEVSFPDLELWATDGTAAGTGLVKDLDPDRDSRPSDFLAFGGHLLWAGVWLGWSFLCFYAALRVTYVRQRRAAAAVTGT